MSVNYPFQAGHSNAIFRKNNQDTVPVGRIKKGLNAEWPQKNKTEGKYRYPCMGQQEFVSFVYAEV